MAIKYLDHKQCNVVLAKILGQTNIGAMLPGSRWNSKFEAPIDYDILPDGSKKDNAEATWNSERGSNCKINAISHVTINLGQMQKHIDTKSRDICYSNAHAILCSSANH
jgi:hypothetical protein